MWPVGLTKEETEEIYNLDNNEHLLNCFTSDFLNYAGNEKVCFHWQEDR